MPEGSNAGAALGWVREDLDRCLETVRENLEKFARDPTRRDALVAAQEELETLNLTFRTMQQQGACLLTDEMIRLGAHLLSGDGANRSESLKAMTDAAIVLPSCLDRLQDGHEDLPILLLPTLNELRAAYDETLMSEGTLFAPDLDVIIPELSGSEADTIPANELAAFSRRVRSLYQGALLGWLQEQSKVSLLEPMQQVCRKICIGLGRNELRRLWWIADKTMQGLRDGAIDNDLPLRRLFARLDLTLRAMTKGGEKGPSSETITALSRALLFQAAQARPGSKATDLLRERFRLEELVPNPDALLHARSTVTGRDANLFQSVGEAAREELAQLKDTLERELRTGYIDAGQRLERRTALQQLADTLSMLNLPVPARAVEDLLPALEDTTVGASMDLDSPLLSLARKLPEVESVLDRHIRLPGEPLEDPARGQATTTLPEHDQRRTFGRLLDECVASLRNVQEAIRRRLDGHPGADFATPLQQIAAALSVASQGKGAALTGRLARALDAALSGPDAGAGDVPNLEPLADAVAALELYLVGCRDEQAGTPDYLEIMESRLRGLPGSDQGEAEAVAVDAAPEPRPAAPDTTEPEPAARESGRTAAHIDAIMLRILLEEFDAVEDHIRERLTAWLKDRGDAGAVADVRRGFQTLKGTGRMVGAAEIGDFAGRFDELLSGFIGGRVPFSESLAETVRLAVDALPGLRARLLGEEPEFDPAAIEALMAFARDIADGAAPEPGRVRDAVSIPPAGPPAGPPADAATPDPAASTEDAADVAAPGTRATEPASGPDTGEVSIDLSRLERQLGAMRLTLKEIGSNVQRLKEQLRKMDMASGAQMMPRHQSASGRDSSRIDRPEPNRFSNMQQLSRALAESVSDLVSLHHRLEDSVRQAEALLTQHSRSPRDP